MWIIWKFFAQNTMDEVGWVLMHSLWQTTIIALGLALVLRAMRSASANLRYVVACLALVLTVACPILTHTQPWNRLSSRPAPQNGVAGSVGHGHTGRPIGSEPGLTSRAQGHQEPASHGMADKMAWPMGGACLSLRGLRMGSGYVAAGPIACRGLVAGPTSLSACSPDSA